MNEQHIRVLLVDDDEDDYIVTREVLSEVEDCRVSLEWVSTFDAGLGAIAGGCFDVGLVDYHLGVRDGLEFIREAVRGGCEVPLILLTGQGDREVDLQAMNVGAADYLVKGRIDAQVLERSIRYSIQRKESERQLRKYRDHLQDLVEERTNELKDANEQLHHSQKMEAIGRLAGGVAHDFNNLLIPILGYSQLELAKRPTGDGAASFEEIQKAAERAADLVHQLLAFSRRQAIEPKAINLNDLIINMDNMLRRLLTEEVELVTLPEQGLGLVEADPGQIEQVIVNLVVNAGDAMPNGGKLTIETSSITLDEAYALQHSDASPGPHVMLSVRDNGLGMNDDVMSHIFEPFFTTKEKGKGTGLGLATCYGIVKQNGGHMDVSGEEGQGATFRVYLPRVEVTTLAPDKKDEPISMPSGHETILLVEDEPLVRKMAAGMLRDLGYTVLDASNGIDAARVIEKYSGEEIHLLLTDVVMPQMGGPELAHQLREIYHDIPVLFMSGYIDVESILADQLRDCDSFLQKPFKPGEFSQKVREVLDK